MTTTSSTKAPLAAEVLTRIRTLYAIEAEIRGHPAEHRRRVRQERSRPIVETLHTWLEDHLPRISGASDLAQAMRYALRHWSGLIVFLDDGRVEMDTNVVECAIRPIPMTRKAALFAGSDGGAHHWAIAMTLIQTANLNGVEPMAYLTDVLERIVSGRAKAHELQSLLPWNWREPSRSHVALAATMIHNLEQAERLMDRLGAALPIPARLTREIQMTLRQQRGVALPANCSVTWISYAGDDGGIVCRLEAAAETAEAVFASITRLRFDPRLPVTREIVAYQKHRVKRLRLQPQ